MIQKQFLFFVFFFTAYCTLSAQEYNYQHYELKEGLSGLTVYSIAQDKDSYLWFGTETGLSRFDGTNFKNFSTNDGLPDNEILKVYVDSKNRVWILPFTNSICYYYKGKIHNQKNDSLLAKVKLSSEPVDIGEDKEGNVFILERKVYHVIVKNSMFSYENKFGDFINIGFDKNGEILSLGDLNEDKKENIVAVLYRLDKNGYTCQVLGNRKDYELCNILSVLIKPNLQIFRSNNQFNLKINEMKSIVSIPDHFISLSYLDDSLISFNCNDTIYLYNYSKKIYLEKFILGKITNSCFRDNEGNYWFATTGYGAYRLATSAFKNYSLIFKNNPMPVYSLFKSDSALMAGTSESLLWEINFKKNLLYPRKVALDVGESRITSIISKNNELIVGSGQGVHYFNNYRELNSKSDWRRELTIKNIYQFDDSLLVTTNRSVFRQKISDWNNYENIWTNRATCAYKFDSLYYIGTLNGLYILNENKKQTFLGTKQPLLSSRISAIVKDSNILWIATYGNGIVAYKNGNIIRHITETNGLSSNMCRTLTIYNGILYAGTDKGLNLINTRDSLVPIIRYTSKDGLNCDIINTVLVDSGTVYAGTPYGITYFNPDKIDTFSISVLNINSIKSKKNNWTDTLNNIVLEAGDNSLKFDYSGVSFKSQGNITYYYKLSGLDTGWRTTTQTVLDYASLAPGTYTFEMYAVNAFGKKSNLVTINITLKKFFYQELWFSVLLGLSLLLIAWLIVASRIKNIRARESEKLATQQRIAELEQLAFKSQMNPHFVFNCLNSIQQYIFNKDVIEANRFITEFSSIIRQTLDISSKKLITLDEETQYLSTYLGLEQKRFDGNFTFEINSDPRLEKDTIYLPPMMLQPFVENSIRHGIRNLSHVSGNVSVRFFSEKGYLFCVIEDNGIGRKASRFLKNNNQPEHISKGISLIEQRADAMNVGMSRKVTIEVVDVYPERQNTGTRVTVKFPLELDET